MIPNNESRPWYSLNFEAPEFQPSSYTIPVASINSKPLSTNSVFSSEEFPALNKTQESSQPFNPKASPYTPYSQSRFLPFMTSSSDSIDLKTELKYGLRGLGLLKTHKPDLVLLAQGTDLSSFHSHTSNFSSPFENSPCAEYEMPEFSLPASYLNLKPILKSSHLKKFSLKTLFYIFYNMPGELLQSLAAEELYIRGWKYCPADQLWYGDTEQGLEVFDTRHWCNFPTRLKAERTFLLKEDVLLKSKKIV